MLGLRIRKNKEPEINPVFGESGRKHGEQSNIFKGCSYSLYSAHSKYKIRILNDEWLQQLVQVEYAWDSATSSISLKVLYCLCVLVLVNLKHTAYFVCDTSWKHQVFGFAQA